MDGRTTSRTPYAVSNKYPADYLDGFAMELDLSYPALESRVYICQSALSLVTRISGRHSPPQNFLSLRG